MNTEDPNTEDLDVDCVAWAADMADLAARFRANAARRDLDRATRRFSAGRAREAAACAELFARCAAADGPRRGHLLKSALRREQSFRAHLDRAGGM